MSPRQNDKERQEDAIVARRLTNDTKLDMTLFAEYDVDGNMMLDFEEFYAMQPKRVREGFTSAAIRDWFNAADLDGNGVLSINEFFRWSLLNASQKHGSGVLQAAFRRYDRDGTGEIDALEFERACADMGFGAVAHKIFSGLDKDGSGTISYRELITLLTLEHPPVDLAAKQMLSQLVLSYSSDAHAAANPTSRIDTTGWTLHGHDAPSVRLSLQQLLRESGCHVADLIKLFDEDADMKLAIDFMEARRPLHCPHMRGGWHCCLHLNALIAPPVHYSSSSRTVPQHHATPLRLQRRAIDAGRRLRLH